MSASIRAEIFPSNIRKTVNFYKNVLRFDLLRHDKDENTSASYVYLQRGNIFIGADESHYRKNFIFHTTSREELRRFRRPPFGTEIVVEVDDLVEERNWVVEKGWRLEADVKMQDWGLRDFRICDPDGYYIRVTEHSENRNGTGF